MEISLKIKDVENKENQKTFSCRLAFERALELDPSNIAAIVALAVLDINTLEPENIRRGIQGLSMAYQMEQENPMALNHLANHFFYKNVWKLFCEN